MRVLHLNDHLRWAGGIETWMLTVLPLLEKRGVYGSLLYAKGDQELLNDGRCIPGIGSNRFSDDSKTGSEVRDAIEEIDPQVIHINGIQNVGAMRACLDSSVPVVMTGHDYRTICPASMFYYKRTAEICQRTCGPGCFTTTLRKHCLTPRPRPAAYYYRRARWTMRRAREFAALIVPSRGAAERFAGAGFPTERTHVLPYFCPMEPATQPRSIPNRPTLTFVGRLAENKGWKVFIKALGELPQDWQGLMVGPLTPELEARVTRLAKTSGCVERLTLQPWAGREEVKRVFRRTSVFVFPSLWPETLGIVGLEALSQGVPVVASDVGGVREWLEDGVNGLLVPPGDASAIAKAALRMLARQCQQRFGQRGIATVNERFLASPHVDQLCTIYRGVTS